jgi:hypothetical protein
LLLFALLGAASPIPSISAAHAQSYSPFDGLSGSWNGEGSIRLSSGATERLRCRTTYDVGGGGDTLEQNLKCASDSYKFELRIELTNNAGAILGNWTEVTRDVRGGISGRGSRGLIQVVASGQSFSASVTVATHGGRQTVNIRSPSGDLSNVSITLHRAR